MSLIDRVTRHFDDLGLKSVAVPEWGEEGVPLTIYWKPLTAQEVRVLNEQQPGGGIRLLVAVLILKALDAEGQQVFDAKDVPNLMGHADVHVITRIANAIQAGPSAAETEKN